MNLSGLLDAVGSVDFAPDVPFWRTAVAHPQLFYFAHPFTVFIEGDIRDLGAEKVNAEHCVARTARLMELGLLIFSPLVGSYPVQDYLGHDPDAQLPWYEIDDQFIAAMHWSGLILAPGWEGSVGCRREGAAFLAKNVPIYYYEEIETGDTAKWKDRTIDVRILLAVPISVEED